MVSNKIHKDYVKKVFVEGNIKIEEVNNWDVREIAEEGIKYVEFYTESFYEKNNEKYDVRVLRFSPKVFFGKRIDLDTAKKLFGDNPNYQILLGNIERNNCGACCSESGDELYLIEENNLTYDEYLSEYLEHEKACESFREYLASLNQEGEGIKRSF